MAEETAAEREQRLSVSIPPERSPEEVERLMQEIMAEFRAQDAQEDKRSREWIDSSGNPERGVHEASTTSIRIADEGFAQEVKTALAFYQSGMTPESADYARQRMPGEAFADDVHREYVLSSIQSSREALTWGGNDKERDAAAVEMVAALYSDKAVQAFEDASVAFNDNGANIRPRDIALAVNVLRMADMLPEQREATINGILDVQAAAQARANDDVTETPPEWRESIWAFKQMEGISEARGHGGPDRFLAQEREQIQQIQNSASQINADELPLHEAYLSGRRDSYNALRDELLAENPELAKSLPPSVEMDEIKVHRSIERQEEDRSLELTR